MTVFEASDVITTQPVYSMGSAQDPWVVPVSVDVQTAADAALLSGQLSGIWERLFSPAETRCLRTFSSGEAAGLIGVSDGYLRQLSLSGLGPLPSIVSQSGRRRYTLDDVNALRKYLDAQGGAKARHYLPHRNARAGEHLQVLAVANFKTGSGKTTTSIHIAQYLALRGYRVLAIDLDPQASMSSLLGYQAGANVGASASIYRAIGFGSERAPFRSILHKTHFAGIHLSPGGLELQEFDSVPRNLAMQRAEGHRAGNPQAIDCVQTAITTVADDFDVVIIDCPPQFGFLTLSALYAATGVIIPVNPQMLDVASMRQFLQMISDAMSLELKNRDRPAFSFLRYLITQYEPIDCFQTQVVAFLRAQFGERVLTAPVIKSSAISEAARDRQTVYELGRENFHRNTYDRTVESLSTVGAEIEGMLKAAWGRTER